MKKLNELELLFYDFEVYTGANWWCVCLINYNTKEKYCITDIETFKNFYEEHKEYIWVGYNSRGYDQFLVKGLLLGQSVFDINREIIEEDKRGHQVVRNGNKIKLYNFDVMKDKGLKQVEGFMGSMIKETDVPFDIQRTLTDFEIKQIIDYCYHDVGETIKVFEKTIEEFNTHLSLIEAFNLPFDNFNKTQAQLISDILGAVRIDNREDSFDFTIVDTLRLGAKYKCVMDWYLNPLNHWYKKGKTETNQLSIDVAGVKNDFGYGGLHGARPNYSDEGIFINSDVASYYPSMMIEYDFSSRNIRDKLKFRDIRDTRFAYKKAKNPLQLPYKIVLS